MVVYHTQYSSYQYCFRVRILGIVLVRKVLLGTRIYSSYSATLLRDGCICYIEGCLVVYSVSESGFIRRVVACVCLRVINTCVWCD
jgi:hypothetical protein